MLRKWILFFSFLTVLLSVSNSAWALHVLIDPGHGGTDSGAKAHGLVESELVLKIGEKLYQKLNNDPRFTVSMTRKKDQFLSLEERVQMSSQKKADLFLSLHANSHFDQRARGFEVYFQSHLNSDEQALYLAQLENKARENTKATNPSLAQESLSSVEAIKADLQKNALLRQSFKLSQSLAVAYGENKRNSVRQAPFYVVSENQVPSALVELGFLSNPKEASLLRSVRHQELLAEKLYAGLIQYKEVIDKQKSQGLD
jgi:N-acetylmuramoyl-L-alanine amidase